MANNAEQQYKKLVGAADTDGQDFEVSTLTLFYLRLKALGVVFKIASNIDKTYGKFDDVVVKRQEADGFWIIDAFQLKYKKSFKINKQLLSKQDSPDFCLSSYCFAQNHDEAIENIKYYIYTNANAPKALGQIETNNTYFNTEQGQPQCSQHSFNPNTEVHRKICDPLHCTAVAQLKNDVSDIVKDNHLIGSSEGSSDFQKLDHFYKNMLATAQNEDYYKLLLSKINQSKVENQEPELSVGLESALQLCLSWNITGLNDSLNGNQNPTLMEVGEEMGKITKLTTQVRELHATAKALKYSQPHANLFKKLEGVADLAIYENFLPKLQVVTDQARLPELDDLIAKELERFYKFRHYRDRLVAEIKAKIKEWWREDGLRPYLTDKSDILGKVVAKVYSERRISELLSYGISFEDDKLKDLLQEMPREGGVFLVEAKKNNAVVSAMVMSALQNADRLKTDQINWSDFCEEGRYLFVDLQTMYNSEKELRWSWTNTEINTLVVDCNTELSSEHERSLIADFDKEFHNQSDKKIKKLLILISHNVRLLESQSNIRIIKKYPDNFNWSYLGDNIQTKLKTKEFSLQGFPISLLALGVTEDQDFLAKIDSEACAQLLENGTRWGKCLDEGDNSLVMSNLQIGPQIDSLLENQNARVVLVVAEPGMRKSTLFTYLANRAKKEYTSAWIVHIKLHECVQFFEKYKSACINRPETIEFLHHCSLASKKPLEKILFNALIKKAFIFVDGVDEICTYVDQVASLLVNIEEMSVARLWVATSPACQLALENKLNVTAVTLY